MSIIISMNDETYTPCTKCGRPMAYCKGQCCGQPKGCSCQEYGPMKAGCLREIEPSCPYQAVIPTLTVEDKSNLKDLADCFVHVSNINTTFYIDDKHRTIVTWAGPVEYDNYDLDANTLGLRSQFLIDHANDYAAYYDKTGAYQKFNFSEGATQGKKLHIYIPSEGPDSSNIQGEYTNTNTGFLRLPLGAFFETPSVTVTDDDGNTVTPEQFVDLQDSLGDYTFAIHVPEMRVNVDGGYMSLSENIIYYHVSAASDMIPGTTSLLPSYRAAEDDRYAVIAGTDSLGAYLGYYNDESQTDYTAQIIIPIY